MAEWFVSSHGFQPPNGTAPCKIPGKMTIYFYVREGEQLSMHAGWNLWNMLIYEERGGATVAKRNATYVKNRDHHCYDYEFGANPGEQWTDTTNGHHQIDALGIFAVGNYSPPHAAPAPVGPALPRFPQTVRLSAIVSAAAAADVWHLHVGTCRERAAGGQVITPRWLS